MYAHPSWGKYVDAIQVEVSAKVRKWIGIGLHSYVWKQETGGWRLRP